MAMDLYGRRKPDFVVLETGLGGRLDTTNVIRHPLACVITSISLDHTQYLGDTVELIAAEKAGIIKPGVYRWCMITTTGQQVPSSRQQRTGLAVRLTDLRQKIPAGEFPLRHRTRL